jgi:hypothetical protein
VSEKYVRRTRAWVVGILGGLALFVLALSALFAPEAMAAGAPMTALGVSQHICPGCPLCGMSRAFSSVSHAQFARALSFNMGVLVAYPAAVAFAVLGPWLWARELFKRS